MSSGRLTAQSVATASPGARWPLGLALAALGFAASALGQTQINWAPTYGMSFSTDANWLGGVAPADDLTTNIAGIGTSGAVSVTGPRSVAGLNISVGNVQFGGTGPLTIGAGGISISGSQAPVNTITVPLVLGASQTFTFSSTDNGPVISSTIDLQNFALTFSQPSNIGVGFQSNISGTGSVRYDSSGTATVSVTGVSTYSGGTTLAAGDVFISANTPFGTGTITFAGGTLHGTGTLSNPVVLPTTFNGAGSVVLAGPTTLAGNTTFNSTVNYSGAISGNASLTVAGGQTNLSGTNTYTGGTILSGGQLAVNGAGALPGTGSISFTGGLLTFGDAASATTDISGRFSTAAGQAYNVQMGANVTATWATDLTSTGGTLTKGGIGTLVLSGNNTYSGLTTVSAGELRFDARQAFQGGDSSKWISTTLLVQSGATVTIPVGGVTGFTAADVTTLQTQTSFNTGSKLNLDTTNAGGTFSQSALGDGIGSSFALAKSGTGTLILTGANTYTGGTTVTGGTLQLAGGNSTLSATGTVNVTGGTLDLGGSTLSSVVTFNSPTGTLQNGTLVLKSGTTLTAGNVSANLSGTATLAVGAGSVVLSGTNTYSGNTTVASGGTLAVNSLADHGNNSALGTGGKITLTNATLRYTGPTTSSDLAIVTSTGATINGSGTGPLTLTGPLSVSGKGGRVKLAGSTAGNVYAGAISGSNAVNKIDNGTWRLTGTNTYSGNTTVSVGTLQIEKRASLPYPNGSITAFNLIVASGATAAVNVGGTGEFASADVDAIKALGSGAGGFLNGSRLALDTTNATGAFTYASAIANPNSGANVLGVTKLGTGTLVLSGTSTYTGSTIVSAGLLRVDGSLASGSTLTVASGGTVGGTGTINGAATINSGGTLSPGASPGVLSFGSSLTLQSGSTTAIDVAGTTRGTGFDGVTVAGATAYGGTLAFNFTGTYAGGTTFDVFHLTGTPTGSFDFVTASGGYTGSFVDDAGVWTLTSGGQALTFDQTSGSLTIDSATAVPEPMTDALLMSAAALGWVAWRRSRRREPVQA